MSGSNELYDYQQEAARMLLRQSNGGALLALAPRLGKAVVSIRAAVTAEKKHILVVCPLTLLHNWDGKIREWGGGEDILLVKGSRPEPTARWVVTNYDTVRTRGVASGFDLLIFDESVLLKNRRARRTIACRKAADLCRKTENAAVWLLSGAPQTKFYDDLWAQLNIIAPRSFSSYWRFVNQYCQPQTTVWGTKIVGNRPDAEQRLKQDLAGTFFCVNQKDISSAEPFFFENLQIPMAPAQQRMYSEMHETFEATLSELPDDTILAPNVLTQLLRLIQIASNPALVGGPDTSPKTDAVIEMLEYQPLPIVVWTAFIATAAKLCERITAKGYRVAALTGRTPAMERQSIVDNFQAGNLDVLVAHPAVGKYGLELFAAKAAVFAERLWDADNFYQALHRIRLADSPTSHVISLLSSQQGKRAATVDHVIDGVLHKRYVSTQKLTARILRTALRQEVSNVQ